MKRKLTQSLTYPESVTVVLACEDAVALLNQERLHFMRAKLEPHRYGTSRTQANKQYYAKAREWRAAKGELKAAMDQAKTARKLHEQALRTRDREIAKARKDHAQDAHMDALDELKALGELL